ncbi:very low-density lipoprotein receptor-like [Alosa alosa]|uniref:very low-density lipoprotein receptor-like n=1 Tax=Alosa alosa TaxID=278164 RepID=UPI00201545BF|nr:very low-density lipoprotein receptor-like [Alosa alosa]
MEDEDDKKKQDSGSAVCNDTEYQCADGNYIRQNWVCDGDPDCSDGSDEKTCNYSIPHVWVARWMDSDDSFVVGCVHKGNQRDLEPQTPPVTLSY